MNHSWNCVNATENKQAPETNKRASKSLLSDALAVQSISS